MIKWYQRSIRNGKAVRRDVFCDHPGLGCWVADNGIFEGICPLDHDLMVDSVCPKCGRQWQATFIGGHMLVYAQAPLRVPSVGTLGD